MNHRQRRTHALVVVALIAALPAGVAVALDARAPIPVMQALPQPLAGAESTATPQGVTPLVLGDMGLSAYVVGGRVQVMGTLDRAVPGPLLYWAPRMPETLALPDGAVFLGRLADDGGGPFSLPASAGAGAAGGAAVGAAAGAAHGSLVVFSLGHGQVEASAALPGAGGSAGDSAGGAP